MIKISRHATLIGPTAIAVGAALTFTGCEPRNYEAERIQAAPSQDTVTPGTPSERTIVEREVDFSNIGSPIEVEIEGPEKIRVGEEARMLFKLKNSTNEPVYNVRIVSQDGSIQIKGVDNNSTSDGRNEISAGTFAAGESRSILAFVSSESEGMLKRCFAIDYDIGFCAEIEVVKPELTFSRFFVTENGDMFESDYLCERLYAIYRVENVGSGASRPVVVTEQFPTGVRYDNKNRIRKEVGVLESGDVWEEVYALDVKKPVAYTGIAYAETSASRLQSEEDSFDLKEAEISLTLDGPREHKMFRTAQYQLTVRNTGAVIAKDIDVDIDTSALIDADIQWNTQLIDDDETSFLIESLQPGESRTMSFFADYNSIGNYEIAAMADGYCVADPQKVELRTIVSGIPALRLEMIDTEDPVIVGDTTNYRIRVKNQGTARDTNVRLNVQLPSNLEFVEGDGDSPVSPNGRNITLERVSGIDPQEVVEWTITAKAKSSGNVQTKVEMRSNAIKNPVLESEPTNLVAR